MAIEVASAQLTITPKFDKSVRDAINEQLGGSTMSKAGKTAGKTYGAGIAAGVGGAASGIGSTIKSAAVMASGALATIGFANVVTEAGNAADATQKFQKTLSFAGLDTSTIDRLSASTRQYADETVYSLSDVQSITAQLASNGVANYDQLAMAAGNLNAAAGGTAETYKTVGMVLTQTSGLGKLTTENWNQLSEAIPGASGMIKQALLDAGAYTGNFNEAMEKGEITADEFNAALMSLGFDQVAVEAAKSTSTFEGAFGQLQATITGGLADILTTLQPTITSVVNGLSSALGPALAAVNTAVGAFVGAMNEGKGPLEAFGAAFQTLPGPAQAAMARCLYIRICSECSATIHRNLLRNMQMPVHLCDRHLQII